MIRADLPLRGIVINTNAKIVLRLHHIDNPPVTLGMAHITAFDTICRLLHIEKLKMLELVTITNGYINEFGTINFDTEEDGNKMIELLMPYYMAAKLAGEVDKWNQNIWH